MGGTRATRGRQRRQLRPQICGESPHRLVDSDPVGSQCRRQVVERRLGVPRLVACADAHQIARPGRHPRGPGTDSTLSRRGRWPGLCRAAVQEGTTGQPLCRGQSQGRLWGLSTPPRSSRLSKSPRHLGRRAGGGGGRRRRADSEPRQRSTVRRLEGGDGGLRVAASRTGCRAASTCRPPRHDRGRLAQRTSTGWGPAVVHLEIEQLLLHLVLRPGRADPAQAAADPHPGRRGFESGAET